MRNTSPATESRLGPDHWIDQLPPAEALAVMLENQAEAIPVLYDALPSIDVAITALYQRLQAGRGRLIYVGAGTSARIGVQDGAELLPTFDFPAERVAFVIAGGPQALLQPVENAEDSADAATKQLNELAIMPDDCVLGLAASGHTVFTCTAVVEARKAGALTVGISNNHQTPLLAAAEIPIALATGAEVLAGSTRLKAATAQKICLNLMSTALMTRLGHVRNGLMSAMTPRNDKLRRRRDQIITQLAQDAVDGL